MFAYYTPQPATAINDRRSGTIRIASSDQTPIKIYTGIDTILHFAFRDYLKKSYSIAGKKITAKIIDLNGNEIFEKVFIADNMLQGSGHLIISESDTTTWCAGLYNLIIEYEDDFGRTLIAQTANNRSKLVVEIIEYNSY